MGTALAVTVLHKFFNAVKDVRLPLCVENFGVVRKILESAGTFKKLGDIRSRLAFTGCIFFDTPR